MTVDPVDLGDRAEVESEHFERTAGSVYLDSGANDQDQSPQRGSRVTTDQVSLVPLFFCHDRSMSDSSDAGIACRWSTQSPRPGGSRQKRQGYEDVRKGGHECH